MSTFVKYPDLETAERSALHPVAKAELWLDRFAPILTAAIILLFALWGWHASKGTRFQFDELLEVSAAEAPTVHDVLGALAAGVDFNPPLSHLLVRGSLSVFGGSEWAARLPAFAGFLVLLVSLQYFVSRRIGRSYAAMAVLILLCTPVRYYAIQARPYGLVLGLTALVLVLYRRCWHGPTRPFALVGLGMCTAALLASHYYAFLVIGVLLLAEVYRSWQKRRVDWAVLVATVAPAACVIWSLRDAIQQQRATLTHYFARGNLLSFKHGYDDLALDPLIYCVALILILAAISLRRQAAHGPEPEASLLAPETVFSAGLLLIPLFGAVITQLVTHAYVPRYFLPAAIGFSVCLCLAVKRGATRVPSLVLILVFSLGVGFAKMSLQELPGGTDPLPGAGDLQAGRTPLLFDTPGTYLQAAYYFPELRKNMWVITDPAASLHFRNYDTDDKIMLALARYGRAQTVSLHEAVRRWPSFRLVPRSADHVWALHCLMDAGSKIEVNHPFGNANFIFDVRVGPAELSRIDACSNP